MTTVDIDAVRDWLGRLPGGSLAGPYGDAWDAFAATGRPVLTLFGSYDTGKSSLLRRLLVDAGAEVPAWLTISARHETFEVNDVEVGGCLIRDTPGLAVGAADLRAQHNSGRALDAIGRTDVGIAVLTPQLATAERDELARLVALGWPPGALWFVISRFDEAGVDPEYDLSAYREMGDRKVGELRELLALGEGTPIFVVAPDPFQTAGPDPDAGRETWNEFRGWDGMDELAAAVEAVSPAALPGWRHAAGQRYWAAALDDTVTALRDQLTDYTARAEVAAAGVARRAAWESELDTLDRAAGADLDGLVAEALRTGESEIERALDEWFAKHRIRLERLQQSIRRTQERDHARPSWAGFAALVATLGSPAEQAPASSGAAGHVETVGSLLLSALSATTDAIGPHSRGRSAAVQMAEHVGRYVGVAEAALPLAVYFAKLADDRFADRARRRQDQAAAEELRRVAAECTARVREAWQPFVDDVRAEIIAATQDQADLDASLRALVAQLQDAVAEGKRLHAAR